MSEELQSQEEQQQEVTTEQPQVKTYDEEYVKSLRAEAAKYRTKAKEVETSTQQQQQELMNKVFQALGLEPDPEKNYEQQLTEAQTKAQEAEQRANQRILKAEVKAQASQLGIKAERLPYLLKLADLSQVEFGEDGEPNTEQIQAALEVVLNDFPEFKGEVKPANVGGGSNPPAKATDFKNANKDELTSELSKYGLRPWS